MGIQSYHDERGGCGDWCEDGVSIHREKLKGVWNLTKETLVNIEQNVFLFYHLLYLPDRLYFNILPISFSMYDSLNILGSREVILRFVHLEMLQG